MSGSAEVARSPVQTIVVEELVPFGVGDVSVFVVGGCRRRRGDERAVVFDDVLGVDGDVGLGGVEVLVAGISAAMWTGSPDAKASVAKNGRLAMPKKNRSGAGLPFSTMIEERSSPLGTVNVM